VPGAALVADAGGPQNTGQVCGEADALGPTRRAQPKEAWNTVGQGDGLT
jgi:hypothetical protein